MTCGLQFWSEIICKNPNQSPKWSYSITGKLRQINKNLIIFKQLKIINFLKQHFKTIYKDSFNF